MHTTRINTECGKFQVLCSAGRALQLHEIHKPQAHRLIQIAGADRPNREALFCCLQQGFRQQELFDEMERLTSLRYDTRNEIEAREDVDQMNREFTEIVNQALVTVLDKSPLYTETRSQYIQQLKHHLVVRRCLQHLRTDPRMEFEYQHISAMIQQASKYLKLSARRYWSELTATTTRSRTTTASSCNDSPVSLLACAKAL
eukprot:1999189-Pyramimonas_sp.AAC.1